MAMTLQATRLRLTQAIYFGKPQAAVGSGFVRVNGTTPLTAPWNAGQNITAPTFIGALTGDASLDVRIDGTRGLTANWGAGNFRVDAQNSTRWYNVVAYGADASGVADSTAAINLAIAAVNSTSGVLYFPRGSYRVTAGLTVINGAGVYVCGDSYDSTVIDFAPIAQGTVFEFSNGAATVNGCGIFDLRFNSSDVAFNKTMVLVSDASGFTAARIMSRDGGWTGAGSIGVRLQGREQMSFSQCLICADVPVQIEPNPNAASISLDLSSFRDCVFIAGAGIAGPVVNVLPASVLTFVEFQSCDFIRGSNGLYFVDTSIVAGAWINVRFIGCKAEQTVGAVGYTLDIESTTRQIQGIVVDGFGLDPGRNGIRLGNAKWPVLKSLVYGGTGTYLDLSGTVNGLSLVNSFSQVGSTITDNSTNASTIASQIASGNVTNSFGSLTNPAPATLSAWAATLGVQNSLAIGNSAATRELDLNGVQRFRGIAAPAVSEANSATTYFDQGTNTLKASLNGSAYVDVIGSAGLTGSGTATKIGYWTGATTLAGAANIYTDATNHRLGVKVAAPAYQIDCDGDINLTTGSIIRVNALQVFKTDAASGVVAIGGVNGAALGNDTTVVGHNALASSTGVNNVAVGFSALNVASTGTSNTALGMSALPATTTGGGNIAVGYSAGLTNETGSNNVFLGSTADATANNLDNAVAIGYQATVAASDTMSLGNASMKVGIHTTTAKTGLDVDSAVCTRHKNIAVVNGLNSDIALTDTSWVRLTGPTGGFSIGGFTGGTDGRHLTVYNTVAQQMTIVNADASSAAANQITTLTGGNVVLRAGTSAASFIYEDVSDTWILVSSN